MSINVIGLPANAETNAFPVVQSRTFNPATHSVIASTFFSTDVTATTGALSFAPLTVSANGAVNAQASLEIVSFTAIDAIVVGTPSPSNTDVTTSTATVPLTKKNAIVGTALSGEQDWQARISQPGVVWYHDFRNAAEVDAFRWSTGLSPGGNNPDDLAGGRLVDTVELDTSDGITGGGCLKVHKPAGSAEGQTWWRQFSPLKGSATAADGRGSGKVEDDPGADGTIAALDWNPTPDATEDWDAGFYGHQSFHTSNFDGTEFYLQVRVKNDANHLAAGNPDGGKIFIFNRAGVSNDLRQIVVEAADPSSGFNFFSMNRSGSPPLEQDTPGNSNQPGSDFGFCDWSVSPSGCWDWSGGWDTYLFHMVPGLGSDDMVVQVWSAKSGETSYTKIWDQDTVGVSFNEVGGEGYNAFNASCFLNGQTYVTDIVHKFDQMIFSKDPIVLPLDTPTNLDVRARSLTSGNTPVLGTNYFLSEDGDENEIVNNRTANQGSTITWNVEGLFYDPIRRRIHQLDRQHSSTHLEHAWYDEVANQWNQVTTLQGEGDAAHWRTKSFDPKSGKIYWFREAQNALHIYDPSTDAWSSTPSVTTNGLGRVVTSGNATTPACCGFHPNLFGSGKAGVLIIGYWDAWAWNVSDETWSILNTATLADGDLRGLSHGEGYYIPGADELLITNRAKNYTGGENQVFAFAAGAGLETNLSTGNSASLRNKPLKMIASAADTARYYGCIHPRQPNVLLGFDAANPATVYYTNDAAVTAWKLAPFTSPFAAELNYADGTTAKMSVGSIPHHGLVAGFDSTTNNTRFCFWRPPLVPEAKGNLVVSPNTSTQLSWSNGDPLLISGAGDPEGFLFGSNQSTMIQKLADNGGNCIYMQMVRSHGGDGGSTHNPFISNNPSNGVNQSVLDQWNTWFAEMEAARIAVLLFFYDDGSNPWGDAASDTLSANEKAFIDACIATFGARKNIIWVHAEEYQEVYSAARASAFAAYLRANDTYARPIAVHQTPGLTADLEDDANVDIFAIQNQASAAGPPNPVTVHSQMTTAYSNLQGKQHLAAWEVQPTHSAGTDDQTRQVSWACYMAGASVAVIGWDIANTSTTALNQARYAQLFFEASRFQYMAPDDARIAGQSTWALAEASNSFIVYSQTATTNLGVTGLDAVNYNLTWMDVKTGVELSETKTATSGSNTFTKPGGITGNEVALYGVKA